MRWLVIFLALTTAALAQAPPSPEKLLQACIAQRDQALSWHMGASAAHAEAQAEIAKLKAEIEQLKGEKPKPDKPQP